MTKAKKEEERDNKKLKWIVQESEREKRNKNIIVSGIEVQDKDILQKWFALRIRVDVTIRKI